MDIYQTKNFRVAAADKPHITRRDGGHIVIIPKKKVVERTKFSPKVAIEFIRLSMIVGEAFKIVMNRNGVDLERINYQDNGNWSVFKPEGPHFHLHLYGRAKIQKYGQATYFPHIKDNPKFYEKNERLNKKDIADLKKEIQKLFKTKKYDDRNWHL